MNNQAAQTFICFGLPWLAYFLVLLLGKSFYFYWENGEFWQRLITFPRRIWFWCNFLPPLFFFGIGLLINRAAGTGKPAFLFNPRKMALPILVLVAADQAIQYFMATNHASIQITVVEDWLAIVPWSVQTKGDGYISTGQMPVALHLMLTSLGALILCVIYRLLHFFEQNRSLLCASLLFLIAGNGCTFLNLILYNGGYDYIRIYPLVVFDVKDMYLDIAAYAFLQSGLQNAAVLNKVRLKDLRKYGNHEYQAIKRLLPLRNSRRDPE